MKENAIPFRGNSAAMKGLQRRPGRGRRDLPLLLVWRPGEDRGEQRQRRPSLFSQRGPWCFRQPVRRRRAGLEQEASRRRRPSSNGSRARTGRRCCEPAPPSNMPSVSATLPIRSSSRSATSRHRRSIPVEPQQQNGDRPDDRSRPSVTLRLLTHAVSDFGVAVGVEASQGGGWKQSHA